MPDTSTGTPVSNNEHYRSIARKVKDGSCVLFLGSGAVMAKDTDGQYKPVTSLCAQYLAEKYKLQLSAEETQSLSYVCSVLRVQNRSAENILQEDVAAYYAMMADKFELHPMLEQLTDLRFRIIINATPDLFVSQLYDQVAVPYFSDFYNFYKPSSGFNFDFEKDRRVVIYNLLGTYLRPESLVLTYKHQLNYIRKIVGEQQNERLPDALTNAFKDFRHHLFLGFDFDEWALRLMLDTLYKNVRENIQPAAYPAKTEDPAEADTKVFFQGEFGMQFPGVDMETFVTNLIAQYNNLDSPAFDSATETPRVKMLVLYNEAADKDAFDTLAKHLRGLQAQIVTLADGTGEGDMQAWLRRMLEECQVILPLLSADFYNPALNPAVTLLQEIAQKNNPRKGSLVMPIFIKSVTLDDPLWSLATLRPSNRTPLLGNAEEAQFTIEIVESLKKYIENRART